MSTVAMAAPYPGAPLQRHVPIQHSPEQVNDAPEFFMAAALCLEMCVALFRSLKREVLNLECSKKKGNGFLLPPSKFCANIKLYKF